MCAIVKTIFADFNPILINFTHYLVHSLSSASNIVKHYQQSLLHNHSFILIQTSIIKVKKKKTLKIGQIIFMHILKCTCIYESAIYASGFE